MGCKEHGNARSFCDDDCEFEMGANGTRALMSDGTYETIVEGPTRGGGLFGEHWTGYYTESGAEVHRAHGDFWYEADWTGPTLAGDP